MKKGALIFSLLVFLGLFLGASNYQFDLVRVEGGSWQSIPVECYSLSEIEVSQYIDATESTTYGTITNGPPNGMGQDSDGPDGDTELQEAGYEYEGSPTLIDYFVSSYETGWGDTGWTVTSGYIRADQDSGVRKVWTNNHDLSSYNRLQIIYDYSGYVNTIEAGEYALYADYGGGNQSKLEDVPEQTTTWVRDREYEYACSAPYVIIFWVDVSADDNERMQLDNVELNVWLVSTYYRFEAVFRFDSLDTGYENYYLAVELYSALTGSDDLDFYIGTTSNPSTLVGADKQDTFSVNVTQYITETTIYVKIADDYRTGDAAQTTAYIERLCLVTEIPCYWTVVGESVVWFNLLGNNLSGWFVFLGLCMIPASTVFLVWGGRKKMSFDKMFIFLLVFIFGWALFLGGIGP